MDDVTFRLNSLQDARTFEAFLSRYYVQKCGTGSEPAHADFLSVLFSHFRVQRQDNRLFMAVVDLEITYLFMMRDTRSAAGVWNLAFSPGHPQPKSVLHGFDSFAGKVDILYSLTGFSLRCRSFWDKYMGILFLLYDRRNYEKFMRSKSRKRFFERLAGSWDSLSPHISRCLAQVFSEISPQTSETGLLDKPSRPLLNGPRAPLTPTFPRDMVRLIDALDDIRTAEAHGTGSLRKWSLALLPLHESRDFSLLNHWNIANSFMHAIRSVLLDITRPSHSGVPTS